MSPDIGACDRTHFNEGLSTSKICPPSSLILPSDCTSSAVFTKVVSVDLRSLLAPERLVKLPDADNFLIISKH